MTDVDSWLKCHLPELRIWPKGVSLPATACERYEEEMIYRTAPAVLASRKACIDAHDTQKGMDGDSPLVSKRKVDV